MLVFWNLERVLKSLIKWDIVIGQDGRLRPLQSIDCNLKKRSSVKVLAWHG